MSTCEIDGDGDWWLTLPNGLRVNLPVSQKHFSLEFRERVAMMLGGTDYAELKTENAKLKAENTKLRERYEISKMTDTTKKQICEMLDAIKQTVSTTEKPVPPPINADMIFNEIQKWRNAYERLAWIDYDRKREELYEQNCYQHIEEPPFPRP